ncbi:MAG: FtsQ-type POTRA domain-containing protein [Ruminococcaceae bacterium]|nr:FtsQ-type POTRA domain-containing protein [Oscillospiraceae bacterium]
MNSQNDNNTYENNTDNNENLSYDFVSVQDTKEDEKIKREGKNSFVWFCLLFAILSFLLFTPAFNIKNIVVKESNFITVEQIIEVSQIVKDRNILSVNTQKAEERIKKLPLVKEVYIERKFPSTIEITVKERDKRAYISHMNKYICIDETGKIVEILNTPSDTNLMIIKNSSPKEFFLGDNVVFKDADKLDILKEFFKTLDDNQDMPNKIVGMDLKNKKEIYITLDNDITVNIGDSSNLSYKMAYLKQALLTQLKTYRGGTLDLSDPENVVRYKGSAQ